MRYEIDEYVELMSEGLKEGEDEVVVMSEEVVRCLEMRGKVGKEKSRKIFKRNGMDQDVTEGKVSEGNEKKKKKKEREEMEIKARPRKKG